MTLTLPSRETDGSLLIEHGEAAGRRFRLETSICENPVCQCKSMTLRCFPQTADGPERDATATVSLELDLVLREVSNRNHERSVAGERLLAEAVNCELGEPEWTALRELYLAVKERATEQADPDKLDARFPPDVFADHSTMVAFCEILPYARPIRFTLNGKDWVVEDEYCVNPVCSCQETVLSFLTFPPEMQVVPMTVKPAATLFYDYPAGRITTRAPESQLHLGRDLLAALNKSIPDLRDLLAGRHGTLRRLFHRALASKSPRVSAPKPGRNDPCPCGSGKKFKKCCGA